MRLPNYCNASSQRNNLVKLAPYDNTKENGSWLTDSPSRQNLKLSHGGPSQRLPNQKENTQTHKKRNTLIAAAKSLGPLSANQ